MGCVQDEKRQKLITEVQKLGNFWQSSATSESLSAIRSPTNKEKQQTAARYVLMHDTQYEVANKIVQLINVYWPREEGDNK